MTPKQENQLKSLFYTVRTYLNEEDVEDANKLCYEIEELVAQISKWMK